MTGTDTAAEVSVAWEWFESNPSEQSWRGSAEIVNTIAAPGCAIFEWRADYEGALLRGVDIAQIADGKVTGARTYFGLTSALRLGGPQT